MSWNHTQEYETAGYQDYAARLGGGQYEKIWDLGAFSVACTSIALPDISAKALSGHMAHCLM